MFNRRFWDRFLTPLVLGGLTLALAGYRAISGKFGVDHTLGLLAGLLGGFLSFCFFEVRAKKPGTRPVSTLLALLFSPVVSPFLFFWPPFAVGFIFGSLGIFALSLSLASLQEEIAKKGD